MTGKTLGGLIHGRVRGREIDIDDSRQKHTRKPPPPPLSPTLPQSLCVYVFPLPPLPPRPTASNGPPRSSIRTTQPRGFRARRIRKYSVSRFARYGVTPLFFPEIFFPPFFWRWRFFVLYPLFLRNRRRCRRHPRKIQHLRVTVHVISDESRPSYICRKNINKK